MCDCKTSMDIRGRCDYTFNAEEFKSCPARVDTALFYFNNDYQMYKRMQRFTKDCFKNKLICDFIIKIGLTEKDADEAVKQYWIEHKDEKE